MKKLMAVLTVSVLLTVVPAFGGQLLKSQVAADADWVAHLNLEQLVKSQIGRFIRAELDKQGIEEQLQGFQTLFSFHPIDDIRDVTIYGSGSDREKAVALFEGSFDKDKLVALVRMNPEYKEIKQGDLLVHSWVDENKEDPNGPDQRMYGCTYKDNMVVLGAGLEPVKQALDILKGSAPNAAAGVFKQEVLKKKGAFFQIAANAVNDLADHKNEAALLEQIDELGAVIGEQDGKFYVNLSLRAKSEEGAQNVKQMIEGIIAFLSFASEQPALAEVAEKLKLSIADRAVAINFESSTESVFTFLKETWQAEKNKKEQTTAP